MPTCAAAWQVHSRTSPNLNFTFSSAIKWRHFLIPTSHRTHDSLIFGYCPYLTARIFQDLQVNTCQNNMFHSREDFSKAVLAGPLHQGMTSVVWPTTNAKMTLTLTLRWPFKPSTDIFFLFQQSRFQNVYGWETSHILLSGHSQPNSFSFLTLPCLHQACIYWCRNVVNRSMTFSHSFYESGNRRISRRKKVLFVSYALFLFYSIFMFVFCLCFFFGGGGGALNLPRHEEIWHESAEWSLKFGWKDTNKP